MFNSRQNLRPRPERVRRPNYATTRGVRQAGCLVAACSRRRNHGVHAEAGSARACAKILRSRSTSECGQRLRPRGSRLPAWSARLRCALPAPRDNVKNRCSYSAGAVRLPGVGLLIARSVSAARPRAGCSTGGSWATPTYSAWVVSSTFSPAMNARTRRGTGSTWLAVAIIAGTVVHCELPRFVRGSRILLVGENARQLTSWFTAAAHEHPAWTPGAHAHNGSGAGLHSDYDPAWSPGGAVVIVVRTVSAEPGGRG